MANAITTLQIIHPPGVTPTQITERYVRAASERREAVLGLASVLTDAAHGVRGARVRVRVDSSAPVAAEGTVLVEADDTVAGDILRIFLPSGEQFAFEAVALDADVTAAPGTGLWSLETVTDTAQAVSLKNAINAMPGLRDAVVATESSGTVTITSLIGGTRGNSVSYVKAVTTAGALTLTQPSGGYDHGALATATITCGTANITADDTLTIGSVVLTWKASAATEDEVTLSTTEATAATNLTAAINAHSKLSGLIVATRATAVVTITYQGSPREGELIYLARTEVNSGSVTLSPTTTMASGATEAVTSTSATVYALGVA